MEIRNLTYRYAKKDIFTDYTLRLPCSCAILGPNGSGKTTLLRILAHELQPEHGEISFRGQFDYVSSLYISDDILFNDISLLYQIRWLADLYRFPCDWVNRQIELFQLEHMASLTPSELSAGQRHWAALCVALSVKAPVVLLDEPLIFLDSDHRMLLGQIVQSLSKSGTWILATGHEEDRLFWSDYENCINI